MACRVFLLSLTLFFAVQYSAFAKTIETVISNGMGTSVQLAAQNAAENALTQVVGSFLDAETQLKKRTEIRDGVVEKTKIISKDIKDYSQGTIKYFDILEVTETSGIFRVTAKVDVRIDDFKAYIKELAAGEQKVGAGLFGVMKAEKDDEDNQASLLVDKIALPIMRGEVHDITIAQPVPASVFFEDTCEEYLQRSSADCSRFRSAVGDVAMTVVIPFKISLKPAFYENILKILDNISDGKNQFKPTSEELYGNYSPFFDEYSKENQGITLIDTRGNSGPAAGIAYSIPDIRKKVVGHMCSEVDAFYRDVLCRKLSKKYSNIFGGNSDKQLRAVQNIDRPDTKHHGCVIFSDLKLSVFDNAGNPLVEEVWETCETSKRQKRERFAVIAHREISNNPTLNLYTRHAFTAPVIYKERSYVAVITLNPKILEKAASMKIEYMQ